MSAASDLKEYITIQQQTVTDDGYGGQTVSWTDFASTFAQVIPIYLTQREQEVGMQIDASASYRVNIRMRTDVTAAMRIVWKTHTLAIHSLHENGELLSMLTYEENL